MKHYFFPDSEIRCDTNITGKCVCYDDLNLLWVAKLGEKAVNDCPNNLNGTFFLLTVTVSKIYS